MTHAFVSKCHTCTNPATKRRYWGGREVPLCASCELLAEAGNHPDQAWNQARAYGESLNLPGYVYIARRDVFIWATNIEPKPRANEGYNLVTVAFKGDRPIVEDVYEAQAITKKLLDERQAFHEQKLERIDKMRQFHRNLPDGA